MSTLTTLMTPARRAGMSGQRIRIATKRAIKTLVKAIISRLVRCLPNTACGTAACSDHTAAKHRVYGRAAEQARHSRRFLGVTELQPARSGTLEGLLASADPNLDHAAVLVLLVQLGQLKEAALHRYLTALFVARRVDILAAVVAEDRIGYPLTRLFHRWKLQQYRGTTDMTPATVVEGYSALRSHPMFADAALNLAVDTLVRLGDVPALTAFIRGVPVTELTNVAPPTFLGCFRVLEQAGAAQELATWRSTYLAALRPEQRLYHLEIMPATAAERVLATRDWRALATLFRRDYSAADDADHRAIQDLVFTPLDSLPRDNRDCMNIRFDERRRDALFSLMTAALSERRPLALVRLGDGEGYGYQPPAHAALPLQRCAEDNTIRERMWWGATITASERERVTAEFRAAVADADIIGLPSIYRIIRDRGAPGSRFGETGGQRGIAVVLAQLGGAIPLMATFTEERCHQILFRRAQIETLCRLAERVVLVSCWRSDQLDLGPYEIHDIVIPPHTKVAGIASAAGRLTATYQQQVADMAVHCAPGTLVLVGAGFIGKIFVGAARARGAVALDVGAMLDYMAGYKTRSLADLA